ncbi:chrromatin organization modifier domain-containing protein [Besnoitia besnoiti]|uniref:Chrromatin organization modifier domain-containing protein n=1 Tax=Besnoitia besnoiti TaxID=94643 RepID=A0A2A9MGB9_BESBE|nr:chrromatin organization modifier domain-containing protein [Besnoitia besnoiti]PFH34450.1 chrromatin organization modifier domain-containing protein [Besnoitia besnoiti]
MDALPSYGDAFPRLPGADPRDATRRDVTTRNTLQSLSEHKAFTDLAEELPRFEEPLPAPSASVGNTPVKPRDTATRVDCLLPPRIPTQGLPSAARDAQGSGTGLLVYVTGFGPFGSVQNNPTGCLVSNAARALRRAQAGEQAAAEEPQMSAGDAQRGDAPAASGSIPRLYFGSVRTTLPFEQLREACSADVGDASALRDGRRGSRAHQGRAAPQEDSAEDPHRLGGGVETEEDADAASGAGASRRAKDGDFRFEEEQGAPTGKAAQRAVAQALAEREPPVCRISSAVRLCGAEILEAAAKAVDEAAPRIRGALHSARCSRIGCEQGREELSQSPAGEESFSLKRGRAVDRTLAVASNRADAADVHSAGGNGVGTPRTEAASSVEQRPSAEEGGIPSPEGALSVKKATPPSEVAAKEEGGARSVDSCGAESAEGEGGETKKLVLHLGLNQAATAFELEQVGVNGTSAFVRILTGLGPAVVESSAPALPQ